eukprot:6192663-Pleurochrysis_carterae.AAC.2
MYECVMRGREEVRQTGLRRGTARAMPAAIKRQERIDLQSRRHGAHIHIGARLGPPVGRAALRRRLFSVKPTQASHTNKTTRAVAGSSDTSERVIGNENKGDDDVQIRQWSHERRNDQVDGKEKFLMRKDEYGGNITDGVPRFKEGFASGHVRFIS